MGSQRSRDPSEGIWCWSGQRGRLQPVWFTHYSHAGDNKSTRNIWQIHAGSSWWIVSGVWLPKIMFPESDNFHWGSCLSTVMITMTVFRSHIGEATKWYTIWAFNFCQHQNAAWLPDSVQGYNQFVPFHQAYEWSTFILSVQSKTNKGCVFCKTLLPFIFKSIK